MNKKINDSNILQNSMVKYIKDGKVLSYMYIIVKDGKKFVVKDDNVISDGYDDIYNLIYSPNGKNIAFKARKNGKSLVVKDFKESNLYDSLDPEDLEFIFNGKNLFFTARIGDEKKGK